jgi:hypothetical protein
VALEAQIQRVAVVAGAGGVVEAVVVREETERMALQLLLRQVEQAE